MAQKLRSLGGPRRNIYTRCSLGGTYGLLLLYTGRRWAFGSACRLFVVHFGSSCRITRLGPFLPHAGTSDLSCPLTVNQKNLHRICCIKYQNTLRPPLSS